MSQGPIMVVLSNTVPGADVDDFNEWYTGGHISQVLALDYFLAADRYEIHGGKEGQHRFLTIFTIEDGKLEEARKVMSEANKSGYFKGHPALAMDFVRTWHEPIASRRRGDGK
jgi:hypothetical protein